MGASPGARPVFSTAVRGGCGLMEVEKAFLVVRTACAKARQSERKESVPLAGSSKPGRKAGQPRRAMGSPQVLV